MERKSPPEGDEAFQVRRLELSDKGKGFLELLQQLTVCESVPDEIFLQRFQELGDNHLVCVIEDSHAGKIVATGSLFIERKFIRTCGEEGHVEDVVVDSAYRGRQLGKKIIGFLVDHAIAVGSYKVNLNCSDGNVPFYEKCGLVRRGVQMGKYFT